MRNPLVAPSPLAARYGGIGHGRLSTGIPDYPRILLDGTAWWRADKEITLNGSTVSAWGDLTGNGNTATQDAEANQPTYTQNAIGGKPGLTFAADFLEANHAALRTNGALTIFAVIEYAIINNTGEIIRSGEGADMLYGFQQRNATLRYAHHDGSVFKTVEADTGIISAGTPVIAAVTRAANGTDISFYLNNAAAGTGSTTTAPQSVGTQDTNIGAASPGVNELDAIVPELAVFKSVLNSSERQSVFSYMASRYGVALA